MLGGSSRESHPAIGRCQNCPRRHRGPSSPLGTEIATPFRGRARRHHTCLFYFNEERIYFWEKCD